MSGTSLWVPGSGSGTLAGLEGGREPTFTRTAFDALGAEMLHRAGDDLGDGTQHTGPAMTSAPEPYTGPALISASEPYTGPVIFGRPRGASDGAEAPSYEVL